MSEAAAPTVEVVESRTFSQRMLDGIERAGNTVPHPVMIFVYLIALVIVLSVVLDLAGVSVTEDVLFPEAGLVEYEWVGGSLQPVEVIDTGLPGGYVLVRQTVAINSLLSVDGIRFIFTSFVNNFAHFNVVAVIFVAMIGVGVAEEAGLMAALIRGLVRVTPRRGLTLIIVLIGALSSVATDAGYLILIPLGAAAFLSVNRHPLVGIAAAFAGVSAVFAVNVLIAPLDALLTELTNEAIQITNPDESISIGANLYFAIASTLLMTVVVVFITERIVEPRLGVYVPEAPAAAEAVPAVTGGEGDEAANDEPGAEATSEDRGIDSAAEGRGLRLALLSVLGGIAVIVLLTAPSGAPLRDPVDGSIIGNTPFMDSLIFMITLLFLVAGIGFGIGVGSFKSSTDVISGITKTFAGLAGLIFMLLVISQFIAYFNYTNMPQALAGGLANTLEQADVRPTILLVGFIIVIAFLNIIIPNVVPKWAIFAPVFVPLFGNLGVSPQTVLAAYRVGDSPTNVITPLMVYLPFIVLVAQRYQKKAGLGTIVAMMLPYSVIVLIIWTIFFVIWFLLGIPLGPGYPVDVG